MSIREYPLYISLEPLIFFFTKILRTADGPINFVSRVHLLNTSVAVATLTRESSNRQAERDRGALHTRLNSERS